MFGLFNSKKIKEIPEEFINRDYINISSNNLKSNIDVCLYQDESCKTEDFFSIEKKDSENDKVENTVKLNRYNYRYIQDGKDTNDEQDDDQTDDDQTGDDQTGDDQTGDDQTGDDQTGDDQTDDDDNILNEDELYVLSLDSFPKFYCTDLKTAQNKIWETAINYNQKSIWNNFLKSKSKNEIIITDYFNFLLFNYTVQSYVLKIHKVKKV